MNPSQRKTVDDIKSQISQRIEGNQIGFPARSDTIEAMEEIMDHCEASIEAMKEDEAKES